MGQKCNSLHFPSESYSPPSGEKSKATATTRPWGAAPPPRARRWAGGGAKNRPTPNPEHGALRSRQVEVLARSTWLRQAAAASAPALDPPSALQVPCRAAKLVCRGDLSPSVGEDAGVQPAPRRFTVACCALPRLWRGRRVHPRRAHAIRPPTVADPVLRFLREAPVFGVRPPLLKN